MNIQQIMKQAQALQKKVQEMQDKMADKEVVGSAGAGDSKVEITTTCKGDVKKVRIAKHLLSDGEMLEDLLVAAFNDAKRKADEASAEEMNSLGISPDMMKMPF